MVTITQETQKKIAWTLALLGYSVWIYYLSSGVQLQIPALEDFPEQDKILHACGYGILAFASWQVFRNWQIFNRPWLWAWCYVALFGASDEWHQYYVPDRYSDVWDWVADVSGAALVLLAAEFIQRRREEALNQPIHFHSPWTPQTLARKLAQRPVHKRLPPPDYREMPRPHLAPQQRSTLKH